MTTRRCVWLAVLFASPLMGADDAELEVANAAWAKEVRMRQEPLVLELEELLGDDTRFVLYSVEPHKDEQLSESERHDGVRTFFGHHVRGFEAVGDRKEVEQLVRALAAGMRETDGSVALCFIPHHGLRIERGGKRVDVLVCFSCLQGRVAGANSSRSFRVSHSPLAVFNEALARHKLPLPREVHEMANLREAGGG